MPWARAVAVWLLLVAVEVVHGILRSLYLAPIVGDFRARQIAVFTGSLLIVSVAALTVRWLRPSGHAAAWRIGVLWLVLMLSFEVLFGRFVAGLTWARIWSDYDVPHGGLLPIGMVVLACAPRIAMVFWRRSDVGRSS